MKGAVVTFTELQAVNPAFVMHPTATTKEDDSKPKKPPTGNGL
jgi:hypothetical protein